MVRPARWTMKSIRRPSSRRRLSLERLETRRVLSADIFLDITSPDIPGGSTDKAHADEIEVQQFSWGFFYPNSKQIGGAPRVTDFQIVAASNQASPELMREAVLGPVHDSAKLTYRLPGENPKEILFIDLEQARLTNFSLSDEPDTTGAAPEDGFLGLTYTKIDFEYREFDVNGVSTNNHPSFEWDLLNHRLDEPAAILKDATDTTGATYLTIGDQDITVDSFNWGATRPVEFNGAIQPVIGVPEPGQIEFTRRFDLASMGLLSKGIKAALLDGNEISLTQESVIGFDGKGPIIQPVSKWTLHKPLISEFFIYGDGANEVLENSFTISFSKLDVEFTPYDQFGKVQTSKTASWDFDTNKAASSDQFGGNIVAGDVPLLLTFPDGSELELDGLDWRSSSSFSSGDPTANLSVFAGLDQSTPGVIEALAIAKSGDYRIRRGFPPDHKLTLDQWDLTDAYISGYRVSGINDAGERPRIDLDLTFRKAELLHNEIDPAKQTIVDKTVGFWDFNDQKGSSFPGFGKATQSGTEPGLELTFTQNGVDHELDIRSLEWGVFRDGTDFSAIDFSVTALRGTQSPGVFWSTASGAPIDNVSIVRHNEDLDEIYRWDLHNVIVTDYSTSSNIFPNPEFEFFALKPARVALTTNEYVSPGKITATRSIDIDVLNSKILGVKNPGPLEGSQAQSQVDPPFLSLSFEDCPDPTCLMPIQSHQWALSCPSLRRTNPVCDHLASPTQGMLSLPRKPIALRSLRSKPSSTSSIRWPDQSN